MLAVLVAQKGELSEAIPAFEARSRSARRSRRFFSTPRSRLQRAGRHEDADPQPPLHARARSEARSRLVRPGPSLAHEGRYEEAIARFREAARLQPFNPYAGYQVAAVLFKLGRRDEVRAEYERVKEFDPKVSELMRREFDLGTAVKENALRRVAAGR